MRFFKLAKNEIHVFWGFSVAYSPNVLVQSLFQRLFRSMLVVAVWDFPICGVVPPPLLSGAANMALRRVGGKGHLRGKRVWRRRNILRQDFIVLTSHHLIRTILTTKNNSSNQHKMKVLAKNEIHVFWVFLACKKCNSCFLRFFSLQKKNFMFFEVF